MLRVLFYPSVMIFALLTMGHTKLAVDATANIPTPVSNNNSYDRSLVNDQYEAWDLAKTGLSESAFKYAMKGFDYLKRKNALTRSNIISIIDFSKPSWQKRLFIIDVITGRVLKNTLVAHGRNSGKEYATEFSNRPESYQSSLGFYITQGTYMGSNGYSLRLKGCERGINDKAFDRAIVMHGAPYVSDDFINNRGFLGRSYGCPSIPAEMNKEIIDVIKNGTCLFIYHPTKKYYTRSKMLQS